MTRHCLMIVSRGDGEYDVIPLLQTDFTRREGDDVLYCDDDAYMLMDPNPEMWFKFKLDAFDLDRWGDVGKKLVRSTRRMRWERIKERVIGIFKKGPTWRK